ncbi:lecithin-cholesterol acyltransferase-like 4 [Andrographis paniculata]|uniref:lecithin-cholesterol acyltransferase-like 4 n=1 Tax=Andrographis paniculata TaxID=175694 RepID=UPI0021E8F554|nr:lecithin-cholesterol acyltransferase-like 4 [Andrographis paniculata]
MAVLLEDIVKSLEYLLKLVGKKTQEQSYVDPSLDPVLLVPGIAGSILNSVDNKTGNKERVWVRILRADHEFQDKLWSFFDPVTGKTVTIDADTHIEVPQDRYGLYAIDSLDPDMVIGCDCVYYFHDMILELLEWGYQEGTTLFGFGYDFRQSNRFQGTLERLASKLESVYTASGGRKMTIISHSMGGLLVKCFMSLHSDIFEKYVKTWIAIAAPFQGAPGYVTSSLFNGMTFAEGWEQNFFVSKWSMHQLLVECPSVYELMGCFEFKWDHPPLLEIWRQKCDSNGNSRVILESHPPDELVPIFIEALSANKVTVDGVDIPLPFNMEILKWASETVKILHCAEMPSQIKFYNVYGTGLETPHSVCYGSEDAPVTDLQQLPTLEAKFINVDGDGTVPAESSKADGLRAEARVGVPGEHRGILCDRHVFRILKHWLKADHDPFYNPINDFVVLPTAFELEILKKEGLRIAAPPLAEDWEVIGNDEDCCEDVEEMKPSVTSICASVNTGSGDTQEQLLAKVVIKPPQNDGEKLTAVSVSASA